MEIVLRETRSSKNKTTFRYFIQGQEKIRPLTYHEATSKLYSTLIKDFNLRAEKYFLTNQPWTFHSVLDRIYDQKRKQYLYLVQWCTTKKPSQSWILRDHADDEHALAMLDDFDSLFR